MAKTAKTYQPRLKTMYNDVIVGDLVKELKLKNPNQVPKLEKIVLNTGIGRNKAD